MLESLFGLQGKVALVAGAGGLGTGMAQGLAEAGAAVVTADYSREHAEAAAELVRTAGGKALALTFDARERTSIEGLMDEALAGMGRLDILVNSVGIGRMGHAEDITPEDWRAVLGVFLDGVFWACQAAARKAFIPQRAGRIVNIASMSGMVVTGDRGSSYATAKAGVIQLSKALATEWARYNIRVNSISQGYMRTALTEGMLQDPVMYKQLVESVPLKRIGLPRDLAGAVVFLVSGASDYVIGQNLVVDGGYTCV